MPQSMQAQAEHVSRMACCLSGSNSQVEQRDDSAGYPFVSLSACSRTLPKVYASLPLTSYDTPVY